LRPASSTCLRAFDQPEDEAGVQGYAAPFYRAGGRVVFVELEATQAERRRRNETPFRLAQKPLKRDIEITGEAARGRLTAPAEFAWRVRRGGATTCGSTQLTWRRMWWQSGSSSPHFGLPRAERIEAT
jgi:hypothetical protein